MYTGKIQENFPLDPTWSILKHGWAGCNEDCSYIYIQMSYATERCTVLAFILRSWNQASYTTMLNTWLFLSEQKPRCVTFVNLLDNQQRPLYCTLYRGYYYRLPNQFTIKELKTLYILKSSIQQKQFQFNTGCWTKCVWARRWVELTGKNVRILSNVQFKLNL